MKWTLKIFVVALLSAVQIKAAVSEPKFIGTLDISERYADLGYWAESDLFLTAPPRPYSILKERPTIDQQERSIEVISLVPGDFLLHETSYENKQMVVYGITGKWVRVKLKDDFVWLLMENDDRFSSYLSLIEGRLAYVTQNEFLAASSAGGETRPVKITPEMQNAIRPYPGWVPSIEILETRALSDEVGEDDWIKIRILDQEPCENHKLPRKTIFEGWVRAYLSNGDISVWYHPRGC